MSTNDDRGPQSGEKGKPLVSDEQVEWHSVHDKETGELVSIETMSPWTVRDLYEAERTKLHELLGRMAERLDGTHELECELLNVAAKKGFLVSAASKDCTCGLDLLLADYNALTKP